MKFGCYRVFFHSYLDAKELKELNRIWDLRELILNLKDLNSNFTLFLNTNEHEQNGFFKYQASSKTFSSYFFCSVQGAPSGAT